jgi:transposase
MESGKKQKKTRRKFSEEYKAGAVRLVLDEGKSQRDAARDLGLFESLIARWVKQAKVDRGKGRSGALTTTEKDELARLRKEVRVLKMERDILKKAAAFFAKESE